MGCPANLSGLHVHSREAAGRRWCRCGDSRPIDTTPVDLQRVRQERQVGFGEHEHEHPQDAAECDCV